MWTAGGHHSSSWALPASSVTGNPHVPLHPDVKLKKLPFYDILDVIMKPTHLGKLCLGHWRQVFNPNDALFGSHNFCHCYSLWYLIPLYCMYLLHFVLIFAELFNISQEVSGTMQSAVWTRFPARFSCFLIFLLCHRWWWGWHWMPWCCSVPL